MSESFRDDLIIQTLRDLKEDFKNLDKKMDETREIHIRNTAVLEEHERRSTASEKRLDLLEHRQDELETEVLTEKVRTTKVETQDASKWDGVKDYILPLIAALGGLVALFHDSIETFLNLKK